MKLKLSEKEIVAVKESIGHWQRDILNPLKKNRKISRKDFVLYWKDTKEEVKCQAEDCTLCDLDQLRHIFACELCPYHVKYGHGCDSPRTGDWRRFFNKPNLINAQKMVDALKGILK